MKRQLPLFLFMAILGAMAFFSLTRVQFSASLYKLLPQDLPEVRGMDWLNRYFSRDGQLIVTVSSEDAAVTAETSARLAKTLAGEADLVASVFEEMPLDRLAREGGSLLAWLWFNADPIEVKNLTERLTAPNSSQTIAESMMMIQDGLLEGDTMVRSYDPLSISRLPAAIRNLDASKADAMASDDGTFRLFYVEGSGVDFSDYRDAAVWLKKVKAFVEQWRETEGISPKVKIGLTGTPAFMAEVGSEMEKDMTLSVIATMALISLLFWLMHRQTQPLGWLIASLCLILILTLTIGGLIFGKLSVMSAGFAAILLGLAVDYGIVLYREAMTGLPDAAALRRKVGPAIIWAALTTGVVFLSLNFSSLPGIAEMGNLVAIGIALGACVMLFGFSRIAVLFAKHSTLPTSGSADHDIDHSRFKRLPITLAIAIPVLALGSIFIKEMPGLEAQFHPFRIRSSPSMVAWQEMQHKLRGQETATPLVVTGSNIAELQKNIVALEQRLAAAKENGQVERYLLPHGLLPAPANQQANRLALEPITQDIARLMSELDEAGFSQEGTTLTKEVLETWAVAIQSLKSQQPFAGPHGRFAEWTVGRLFSQNEEKLAALGSVKPTTSGNRQWVEAISNDSSAVASLGTLGTALNHRINKDLKYVFLPMIGLLALMLAIVFRAWKDWALAMFSLLFAASAMVILTLWTPLSWNSFNICGLPLLFGTGLDFGIHMIFALRRSKGELPPVRHGIAKALLFCGTSSAIGFGSLAFASAHGLASLGQICAAGILVNMIIAVWLLPRWYRIMHRVA